MGLLRVLLIIAGAGFVAGWGCGGGSSASGGSLCEQGCSKLASCGGDGAACKSQCPFADAITASCTNKAQVDSYARSCLTMDCAGFTACIANKPDCNIDITGSGGAGGATTGTASGGSSGTGAAGSSGAASCDICGKADTCCRQLATSVGQSPSSCKYSANCQSMTGADRDSYVMTCSDSVMLASGLGLPGCQ